MAGNELQSTANGNDQLLSTMTGNDEDCQQCLGMIRQSTMISKCPKLLIIAPRKRPRPKLEGAGGNNSANTEKSLLTRAMQFAILFTPFFQHTYTCNSSASHRLL